MTILHSQEPYCHSIDENDEPDILVSATTEDEPDICVTAEEEPGIFAVVVEEEPKIVVASSDEEEDESSSSSNTSISSKLKTAAKKTARMNDRKGRCQNCQGDRKSC